MTVWSTATKVRPILTLRHVDSNMRSDFGGATSGQRFKTSAPRSGRPLLQRWSTAVRGAGLFVALGTSTCFGGEANVHRNSWVIDVEGLQQVSVPL